LAAGILFASQQLHAEDITIEIEGTLQIAYSDHGVE
jgi:hypothetical protein